jgi:hypothetical protein
MTTAFREREFPRGRGTTCREGKRNCTKTLCRRDNKFEKHNYDNDSLIENRLLNMISLFHLWKGFRHGDDSGERCDVPVRVRLFSIII